MAYHHGDLRRAMIDATLALVRERGVASLSLREVARRSGVSTAAPYNHFADREALLAAVGEESLEQLDAALAAALAASADEAATERAYAMMKAHLRFAATHPERYALLFLPELAAPGRHPGFLERADAVQRRIMALAAEARPRGSQGEQAALGLLWWSAVHGLATAVDPSLAARKDGPLGDPAVMDRVLRLAAAAR